ncbi:MAG: carbon storage regulator CsrA [Bacillota bacterium]|jgi:carbon storage regulator
MLVLTRKPKETLIIGEDIFLTVISVEGDKVKIGIEAPAHVSVHRLEVYEAIKRQNQESAGISPQLLAGLESLRPPAGEGNQGR